MKASDTKLAGKLLVAMPDMSDPRFARTVIYMCAHSDEGGMGLIINKPQPDVTFSKLIDQLEIPKVQGIRDAPVYFGGPVERQRGFVLHSNDYMANSGTLEVDGTFRMTATLEVLQKIAMGKGPAKSLLALGYSGWGPRQLEYEIGQNGWLTCPPTEKVVFDTQPEDKWLAALGLMGIDPRLLSGTAGHA